MCGCSSVSGCCAHVIPGIDWRKPLLYLSVSCPRLTWRSSTGGSRRSHARTQTLGPREEGDTHDTSTHSTRFLQSRSNWEPALCLRDPPPCHRSPPSSGYRGLAVSHRKTRCVFFKPRGSNLSQFFRIQFKGVRLELLAPILSCRIPHEPPR